MHVVRSNIVCTHKLITPEITIIDATKGLDNKIITVTKINLNFNRHYNESILIIICCNTK